MPASTLSMPARHIAASIGSTEKIGMDKARARFSARTLLPEPGSPANTISDGDNLVISVMAAFENFEKDAPAARLNATMRVAGYPATVHQTFLIGVSISSFRFA